MKNNNLEQIPILTYDKIVSVAKTKAEQLKKDLPSLPADEELEPFEGQMWAIDRELIDTVRRHLDEWGVTHGHGFEEHIEWAAKNAAYVAAMECEEKGIKGDLRDEIIQRAWRLGLLHDIQRWRGWRKEDAHALEGMKATRQKLQELGIEDSYLLDQVFLHDELKVQSRNDPRFDLPFFSVFAVDHLNWSREWEEIRWKGLAKKKVSPQEAIHDYQFMLDLRDSPNLQQTKWGRTVAIPYIDYGIAIARHVESVFSEKKDQPVFPDSDILYSLSGGHTAPKLSYLLL